MISSNKNNNVNSFLLSLFFFISFALLINNVIFSGFNTNLSYSIRSSVFNVKIFFTQGMFDLYSTFQVNSKTIVALKQENLLLIEEINILEQKQVENEGLKKYISSLESLINFKNDNRIKEIITTSIVNNNLSSINYDLYLKIGSDDGVKINTLVLSKYGVIGYIKSVADDRSEIITINDRSFKMSAITSESRINIIISGTGNNVLSVLIYSDNQNIKPGEVILTSGLEGDFVKYMPIGVILKDSSDNWYVKPNEDLINLEYVYLVR